ncbi:tetratricopeptide repeat protein [Rhodobacterales bacterium HKCCE2091]|nr:tetratricopeptide repeat protein [Rhodobacterales bacterium HKCCE2091]
MRGFLILIAALAALAGCNQPGGGAGGGFGAGFGGGFPLGRGYGPALDPLYEGPDAPSGTARLPDGVDGMVVGDRLMESGEYELALRAYLRAAAENGTDATVLIALGSANLQLGRLGQAEDFLRGAVEEAPEEPVAWNNLGVVLMEQGEFGEARQIFQRAFALDSGRSDAIRENLMLAIARMENSAYTGPENQYRYGLERRGGGRYLLTGSL